MELSQILQILVGLLVILAGVCWFFSWKTWRWHTLMMVVLNFFAAAGFAYLSMRALKTDKEWRNKVRELENTYAKEEATRQALLAGAENADHAKELGIQQLKAEINRVTLGRGRVWRKAKVAGTMNGDLSIELEGTDPHGLAPKSVVQVFDDKDLDKGGEDYVGYLGEFKVKGVTDKRIDLTPSTPPGPKDAVRLSNATTVSLYEMMPIDNADAYVDGVSDAMRTGLLGKLPAATQAEFAKKDRPLNDYTYSFDNLRRQLIEVRAASDETFREIGALKLANTQANESIAEEKAEKTALAADLVGFQRESAAIGAYLEKLKAHGVDLQTKLVATFRANQTMAAEITAASAKALEQINRRSMAQDTPAAESNAAANAFLKAQ
ncbi:MAG TPA: hypothetical protein VFE24_10205 [Pirellulales bacterium]|jgi:hypothetical protein|nr:hypothetical protein [Pirellulales bacterium]